jgi:hypothetical protein
MMNHTRSHPILLVLCGLALATYPAHSQNPLPAGKFTPKLEPIAETKLIMEGLLHANFRGLERLLGQKSLEAQGWTFARGQALLIAEGGNLLMLRPPKNQGQQAWFERAMELRRLAAQLAQALVNKDAQRGRVGLKTVADSCNRCHQTFRIPVQIAPFENEPPPAKAELNQAAL